jgi:translation initiation factor IF-2
MTEEVKSKKLRIYKFAAEYNLSADSLVEFLRKKGYDVKSHMSPLTDEMMSDIANHFKKDIEKAEKHYQKISEFNKKRSEKIDEGGAAPKEEKLAADAEKVVEPFQAIEQEIGETISETAPEIETVEEIGQDEIAETEPTPSPNAEEETVVEKPTTTVQLPSEVAEIPVVKEAEPEEVKTVEASTPVTPVLPTTPPVPLPSQPVEEVSKENVKPEPKPEIQEPAPVTQTEPVSKEPETPAESPQIDETEVN